jgi:hypothetical protein
MTALNTANDVRLGTTQVLKVYQGTTLIWENKPAVPTSFAFTNLGVLTNSVTMSWAAVPNAVSYKVYRDIVNGTSGVVVSTQAGTSYTASVPQDEFQRWYVSAVNNSGGESDKAGPIRVKGGRAEQSIAAGSTTIANDNLVTSASRWRDGTWGYGSVYQPYVGWFSTEAYRYAGFYEISMATLRNAIAIKKPELNGYWLSINCDRARLFFTRDSAVGNSGTEYTVQVSLGNGISYSSGAEPPAQANVYDFTVKTSGAGFSSYAMPQNWFQAIYQQHANYNGLLFRPYRNDGARQEYMAFLPGAYWEMDISWGKIVTQAAVTTVAWS